MNQISTIGFGDDITLLAGYAQSANDRLGNIDLIVENTGKNTLTLKVQEFDGVSSPSGYAPIGSAHTVVPKGTITVPLVLLSKKIGFFGSGNTTANISTAIRNKGNLRGAQIDVVVTGHRNWGWDQAFNSKAERSPGWGAPPDMPNEPQG